MAARYAWQLPQNLVGLIVLAWYKLTDKTLERVATDVGDGECSFWTARHMPGGVSLGCYVILKRFDKQDAEHEWGHCRQSRLMGWLYLLVIGLPSAIHNLWHRKHREADYYAFYTESWADELGGVQRE